MPGRGGTVGELAHRLAAVRRSMKLVVDEAQVAALPFQARKRWDAWAWGDPRFAATPFVPTIPPSIGLLLAFLKDHGLERAVLHEWVSHGHEAQPELCDALWEAVRAILEAPERRGVR